MARMKAAQIPRPGGSFELVEREIPVPAKNQVRIKVLACGVCHSDTVTKEGLFPGIEYPRIPGHEIAGIIDAVGADVKQWSLGRRVGVGWHGGHCFTCDPCRRGKFVLCVNQKVTGVSGDGGYAEYMLSPAEAVTSLPDDISDADAAPLLCAGITVFNALRNSGAGPGDLVAVQGIGGLGHLGLQYARHMGYRVAAIGRGADKDKLAAKLGAHVYIDAGTADPAEELKKLGGARVILATAPDTKSLSKLMDGIAKDGKLVVVGVGPDPICVTPTQIVMPRRAVQGWPSGSSIDWEDTLKFSALTGVRPMIEKYPLEKASEAYSQMLSGRARFRVVLTMGN